MDGHHVAPYQFEPPVRVMPDRNEQDERIEAPADNRLQNTDWCECGNCVSMDTWEESNCCNESPKMMQKLTDRRPPGNPDVCCITQLRGFETVCLDPDVLETAYLQYKEEHGHMQATLSEKYRYIAYRQLVRWCHGILGRNIRVPLPSCAVNRIRTAFPTEGNYTGFQWPQLN